MVCANVTSTAVCGWQYLLDADLIGAAFAMYNDAFLNYTIIILFVLYQFMLFMKARNLTLNLTTGIFFAGLYSTTEFFKESNVWIMFVILAFELGALVYTWFMK